MTVVVLSMAALGAVVLIAALASRWDKSQPDEEPDLKLDDKRNVVATTGVLAATGKLKKR